jgi:hypothetical protein
MSSSTRWLLFLPFLNQFVGQLPAPLKLSFVIVLKKNSVVKVQ